MGIENYEDDRDHCHDHDHDHDDDKCSKCKKERDEYKKERDEYRKERDEYKKERDEWKHAALKYKKERDAYKDFLREALERLGVAVRKLDHLLDDIVDASKKIGKDHDKGHGHCDDKGYRDHD
jgi:chromosome segregation ATPase